MANFIQQVLMIIAIVTTICNCLNLPKVPKRKKSDEAIALQKKEFEEGLNNYIRNTIPAVYRRHFELIQVMSQTKESLTIEIGLEPVKGRASVGGPHENLRCTVQVNATSPTMSFSLISSNVSANCTPATYKIDNETKMISFDINVVPLDSNEANIVTRYIRRNFSGAHLIRLSHNLEKNQTDNKCNVDKNYITYDVFYYYFDNSQNKINVCETDVKVNKRRKYEIEADFDSMENDNADDDNDLNNKCQYLEPSDFITILQTVSRKRSN